MPPKVVRDGAMKTKEENITKQTPKSAQIYKGNKAGKELFLMATHDCGALVSVICSWAKIFICRPLIHNSNFKIMSGFAHFKYNFFCI